MFFFCSCLLKSGPSSTASEICKVPRPSLLAISEYGLSFFEIYFGREYFERYSFGWMSSYFKKGLDVWRTFSSSSPYSVCGKLFSFSFFFISSNESSDSNLLSSLKWETTSPKNIFFKKIEQLTFSSDLISEILNTARHCRQTKRWLALKSNPTVLLLKVHCWWLALHEI